jgi:hypothetical protein
MVHLHNNLKILRLRKLFKIAHAMPAGNGTMFNMGSISQMGRSAVGIP